MQAEPVFYPWPSITNFYEGILGHSQLTKHTVYFKSKARGNVKQLEYTPKVKLHGTCSSISIQGDHGLCWLTEPGKKFYSQSRVRILEASNDNAGFRSFVMKSQKYWKALSLFVVWFLSHLSSAFRIFAHDNFRMYQQ